VSLHGGAELQGCALEVPGDISSAAFFITAAALCAQGEFLIRDVGVNPTRTGIIDILRLMGADIRLLRPRMFGAEPVADLLIRATPLHGIEVPAALVPLAIDEFPVLFIAAAAARGRTVVTNAAELRVKESDRISVMAAGLQAVGIRTEVRPDGIVIEGGEVQGGAIDSHGDHRIAMAFAVASVVARSVIEIADVENVATSFPEFAALAAGAGLEIEEFCGAQAESH
jgi:3-phosphoshikimate 1-carboxyvinyltransferase